MNNFCFLLSSTGAASKEKNSEWTSKWMREKRTIYGFSCHLKAQHTPCVDKKLLKKYLSDIAQTWKETHESNWLSWRMVINYLEAKMERSTMELHQNLRKDDQNQRFCTPKKVHKRVGNKKNCANRKLQSSTEPQEGKNQWHSWANEIKINCEIIYLSVNWVERARENNIRALFKHHFLSSASPAFIFRSVENIKSELLLIFMNANWRFRITVITM